MAFKIGHISQCVGIRMIQYLEMDLDADPPRTWMDQEARSCEGEGVWWSNAQGR